MKKVVLVFIVTCFIVDLFAQKKIVKQFDNLVIEKRGEHDKDGATYSLRVNNMDSLYQSYKMLGKPFSKGLHYTPTKDKEEEFDKWRKEFVNRVIPEDVKAVIKENYSFRYDAEMDINRRPYFVFTIYFDRTGKILHALFTFSGNFNDSLSEEQLLRMYQSVVAEQIPFGEGYSIGDASEFCKKLNVTPSDDLIMNIGFDLCRELTKFDNY